MAVNKVPVLKRCRSLGLEPVSYTHLDVYKRQVTYRKNANRSSSWRYSRNCSK